MIEFKDNLVKEDKQVMHQMLEGELLIQTGLRGSLRVISVDRAEILGEESDEVIKVHTETQLASCHNYQYPQL